MATRFKGGAAMGIFAAILLLALRAAVTTASEGDVPATQPAHVTEPVDSRISAPAPTDGARDGLGDARAILGIGMADAMTPLLLGQPADAKAINEGWASASAHLDRAEAELERVGDALDAEARQRLDDRIEMLRGFGGVFPVLAEADGSEAAKEQLIQACNDLAFYVDDSNPGVAESARLWQGIAYRLAGRSDRTLQVLRPVLYEWTHPRVALWAAIERCNALAAEGQHVAAMALCARLRVGVRRAFKDDTPEIRGKAVDTIRFTEASLWSRWADALEVKGESDEATSARERATELLDGDPASPPIGRWLPLRVAIAGLDGWEKADAKRAKEKARAEMPTTTAPASDGELPFEGVDYDSPE